jgi:hypothetical protein
MNSRGIFSVGRLYGRAMTRTKTIAVADVASTFVGVSTGCELRVWDAPTLQLLFAVVSSSPIVALAAFATRIVGVTENGQVVHYDRSGARTLVAQFPHRVHSAHIGLGVIVAAGPGEGLVRSPYGAPRPMPALCSAFTDEAGVSALACVPDLTSDDAIASSADGRVAVLAEDGSFVALDLVSRGVQLRVRPPIGDGDTRDWRESSLTPHPIAGFVVARRGQQYRIYPSAIFKELASSAAVSRRRSLVGGAAVAISRNGEVLANRVSDTRIHLTRVATGERLGSIRWSCALSGLAFGPCGRLVVALGNGEANVLDLQDLSVRRTRDATTRAAGQWTLEFNVRRTQLTAALGGPAHRSRMPPAPARQPRHAE